MIRKVLIIIAVSCIGFGAQANENPVRAFIKGVVTDSISGKPIEYANVSIFSLPDSTLAGGAITDSTGQFVISSLSYANTKTWNNFDAGTAHPGINYADHGILPANHN